MSNIRVGLGIGCLFTRPNAAASCASWMTLDILIIFLHLLQCFSLNSCIYENLRDQYFLDLRFFVCQIYNRYLEEY